VGDDENAANWRAREGVRSCPSAWSCSDTRISRRRLPQRA